MIKNVIFDIGNVLTDYRYMDFLGDFGYPDDFCKRLADAIMLSPYWCEFDRHVWSWDKIVDAFVSMDPEIEDDIRRVIKSQKGLVRGMDYAIPWIKELKSKGYGVYYLSNFSLYCREDCDKALNFIPYMDGGVFSFECHMVKPDHDIYEHILEKYGLVAGECVFIDDMAVNIKTATEVGLKTILFETYEGTRSELDKLLA